MNATANDVVVFGDKDQVPAHIQQTANPAGNENVSAEDLQIPRLNLLQAMSPQVEELDDAKAGVIHHSITDELFEFVYAINVFYDKEFTLFKKRELGGGFGGNYASREEAQAAVAEQPGDDSDWNIIETGKHAVIAMRPDGTVIGPALMLLSGSKLFFSKRWNTEISSRCDGKDRFAAVWKVAPVKQSNDKGSWYNYKAEFVSWTPEEVYDDAKSLYNSMAAEVTAPADA
jgi:hypothetical protein